MTICFCVVLHMSKNVHDSRGENIAFLTKKRETNICGPKSFSECDLKCLASWNAHNAKCNVILCGQNCSRQIEILMHKGAAQICFEKKKRCHAELHQNHQVLFDFTSKTLFKQESQSEIKSSHPSPDQLPENTNKRKLLWCETRHRFSI